MEQSQLTLCGLPWCLGHREDGFWSSCADNKLWDVFSNVFQYFLIVSMNLGLAGPKLNCVYLLEMLLLQPTYAYIVAANNWLVVPHCCTLSGASELSYIA